MLVERTVSSWQDDRWVSEGKKLSEFHSATAYVLLGEPGIGKSTAFEEEAQNNGAAKEVTARRFISRSLGAHPEWRDAILFIDGLDEVRAGGGDLREPLDSLVCRLEKLGNPRFRLSCREDSWLGHGDLRELTSATIGEEVHLLRLDPLTEQDIHRILAAAGVPDPDGFCWQATNRGLESFLNNPLLLDILIKANQSGSWSEGRLATFDRACQTLATETNREHLDARDGYPFPADEVVLAAGRLCSILLLCGNSGWSRRGPGDAEFPPLSEAGEGQSLLKLALDTKLFEGDVETGRRPRHRQIAEFLAAGFLDRAIRDRGLPASRVLAWMRGIDGMVVPDLRGVSLWLAARNAAFRRPLIQSDPVGIAFHGDAERFSLDETALLFRALEAQLKHQHLTEQWERESSASLGSLMAGPGREILYGMLRAPDRSEFRQRFVERLLRGLGEATQRDTRSELPGSVERGGVAQAVLAATIRDPSWRHNIRDRALIELIWVHENLPGSPSTLLSLLRELADGTLPETKTGALGLRLLDHLYPRHLNAERFWDYVEKLWAVPPPTVESWYGDKKSWAHRLVYTLSPSDVRILLETLVRKARTLNKVLAQNEAVYFVELLLSRGLLLIGEDMEPAELYEWFELVQTADNRPDLVLAHCQGVAHGSDRDRSSPVILSVNWRQAQREIQLALILEGLKRNASQPRDRALDHEIGVKFLGDDAPPGFRRWCLQKATALAETEPASAIELMYWTVTDCKAWGPPLNDEEILTAVRDTPLLFEWHAQHVAAATQPRQARQTVQDREPREADVSPARTDSAGLQADPATPEKLQELGQAYLSGFRSDGIRQARTELGRLLGDDNNLRDSAIRSLRNFATRSDLPALDEIARDHGRGRNSPFSATFLAGIIEEEAAGPYPLKLPDNDVLRRALGFYLLSGLHTRPLPIPVSFRRQEMAHLETPEA